MSEKKYIIDDVSSLEVGQTKLINVDGMRITLVRLDDGFYAVDDICTHENVSLNSGVVSSGEIECPQHGARFDIRTGEVKAFPAVRPLRTYRVSSENNHLFIHVTDKD